MTPMDELEKLAREIVNADVEVNEYTVFPLAQEFLRQREAMKSAEKLIKQMAHWSYEDDSQNWLDKYAKHESDEGER
jgi:hypothetical protein